MASESTAARGDAAALIGRLRRIVGRRDVLAKPRTTRRFVTGYRTGKGGALAVVRPSSLVELWRVLNACVAEDVVVILQAANTGLTGGSTPRPGGYDRPAIVVNTRRLKGVHLVSGGAQAICLAGSTLNELEAALSPLGREPHSVIGSSCIGASVVGGICNNSGGALLRRGPAYTELALYAQATDRGLVLVNELGIALGENPEAILERVERGDFGSSDVTDPPGKRGHDDGYAQRVRAINEPSPARFNNDPDRLCGASGSAGRVAVFAVRVDTFPRDEEVSTFYVGTNDPRELARLRRDMLSTFSELPLSGEYIHRDAFDLAANYGKDIFLAIEALGTARLPLLFGAKAWLDGWADRLAGGERFLSDRILQGAAALLPQHLPERMRAFRDRFEHHLIVKMAGPGIAEARRYLAARGTLGGLASFECTDGEAAKAFLHRFAVASAAIRYRAIERADVEGIVSLDLALPRNLDDWFERLSPELDAKIVAKVYYGHFFCHVFHHDYLVRKGESLEAVEGAIHALLDARGAEYPAEHNVGQHYAAKPALARFYRELDPGNRFNPGIGLTSHRRDWS